jgi:hypothetical protein
VAEQVPNPKKKTPLELKSLARGWTEACVQTLGGVASNGESEAARVSAAIALLDRGWGKPNQPTENKIDGSIEVILRDIAAEALAKRKKP